MLFQGLIRDDPSSPRQHLGSTFYKIALSPFLTIVKKMNIFCIYERVVQLEQSSDHPTMLCCQKKPTLPMSLTHQGESSPVFQGLHGLGSGKLGLLVPPQSHPAVWPGVRHFTSLSLSFLFCKMGGYNAGQAHGRHGTTPASLGFWFFCFFF